MTPDDFVQHYGPLANDIAQQTGVHPDVPLAIAAQETGWGNHVSGNNLWGISPTDQSGQQYVEAYPSVPHAAQAFTDLIQKRYGLAREGQTPEDQAQLVTDLGYNTVDPHYASSLAGRMQTIREARERQKSSWDSVGKPVQAPPTTKPSDWDSVGKPVQAQEEGRPLTNKQAVSQLPLAKRDAPFSLPSSPEAERAAIPDQPGVKPFEIAAEQGMPPSEQPPQGASNQAFARIKEAAGAGFIGDGSSILPPAAQDWLEKRGYGRTTFLDLPKQLISAGLAGGATAVYELAKGVGMPETLARDVAGYIEQGGSFTSGAPHVPMTEPLRLARENRETAARAPVAPAAQAAAEPPGATPHPAEPPQPQPTAPAAPARTMEQEALDELPPEWEKPVLRERETSPGTPKNADEAMQLFEEEYRRRLAEAEAAKPRETPEKPPLTPTPEAQVTPGEGGIDTVKVTPPRIRTLEQIQTEDGVGAKKAAATQMEEIAAVGRPITAEEAAARKAGVNTKLAAASDAEAERSKAEEAPTSGPPLADTEETTPQGPPQEPGGRATPYEPLPRVPVRLIDYLRRPTVLNSGTVHEATIPGGLIDAGGDLKAILGGSKGRPGLISSRGRTLDDATLQAWQDGYFPEHGDQRPEINHLLDAIRDDHNGVARYSDRDLDRVQEYRQALAQNAEIDRLADQHEIPTRGLTRDQFFDALHDRLSLEDRAREIASRDAAAREEERIARKGAAGVPAANEAEFYGQNQARTLKDLENEYKQERLAPEAVEHAGATAETGRAGTGEGGGEESVGPPGDSAGPTGRGAAEGPHQDEALRDNAAWQALLARGVKVKRDAEAYAAQGKPAQFLDRYGHTSLVSKDLNYPPDGWRVTSFDKDGQPTGHYEAKSAFDAFREVLAGQPERIGPNHLPTEEPPTLSFSESAPAAKPKSEPEPTIKTDQRQTDMYGTADAAVQAQAARDQTGRAALEPKVPQAKANEGLFAPEEPYQPTLYSFPGVLFDPEAWRRLMGKPAPDRGFDVVKEKAGLRRWGAEIKAAFSPTSLKGAKPMERELRQHTGTSARDYDQAVHQLDQVRQAVDRLSHEEQRAFTDRIERLQPQPTPGLQAAADALRSSLDEWATKIKGLGRGYLANAIDGYMGHIWGNYDEWIAGQQAARTQGQMQTGATAGNVAKSPLRGPGHFLKKRSFPTQEEGIAQGLIPVTYNPIDLQLIKIHELQKFYNGTKLADNMKENGIARFVREADQRDAEGRGWVELNDRVFQPKLYGASPIGPVEPGKYYANEAAARLFNNYMSTGWSGQSSIYDAIRQTNNALNNMQLGIPGFHMTFVMMDTAISKAALGMQQIMAGHPIRGGGNVLFGAVPPAAVVATLRKGGEVRRAWLDPANASPEMRQIADILQSGGQRISMPKFFQTSASGSFFKSLKDLKNPENIWNQSAQMFRDEPAMWRKAILTPIHIAARLLDTINEPVMGALVPRAKLGVMADLVQNYLRDNPNASPEALRDATIKFSDSVDNRLGQLNYDNLHWNKVAKDIAFITTRSVGWNIGTLREIGGGFVDTAAALNDVAHMRAPQFTSRMAYTIVLPIITAEVGALMTYLATGKPPQHRQDDVQTPLGNVPLDYFYPPTGADEEGNATDRRSIPGYMKDVFAFHHDPIQTALNKTAPLPEAIQELTRNRNFYGGPIYDPQTAQGPVQAYGDFLLNQAMPFAFRAQAKLSEQGASKLDQSLAWLGFQPAPAFMAHPEKEAKFQRREDAKARKAQAKAVNKGNVIQWFNKPSNTDAHP